MTTGMTWQSTTDEVHRSFVQRRFKRLVVLLLLLSLVTSPFSPVLFLNQRRSPPLQLQVSDCSTSRVMCDVPSTAVFCSGSVDCFTGMAYRFLFKYFVTVPMAPIITGLIIYYYLLLLLLLLLLYYYYYYYYYYYIITGTCAVMSPR